MAAGLRPALGHTPDVPILMDTWQAVLGHLQTAANDGSDSNCYVFKLNNVHSEAQGTK